MGGPSPVAIMLLQRHVHVFSVSFVGARALSTLGKAIAIIPTIVLSSADAGTMAFAGIYKHISTPLPYPPPPYSLPTYGSNNQTYSQQSIQQEDGNCGAYQELQFPDVEVVRPEGEEPGVGALLGVVDVEAARGGADDGEGEAHGEAGEGEGWGAEAGGGGHCCVVRD